jgi:hypothetical protein
MKNIDFEDVSFKNPNDFKINDHDRMMDDIDALDEYHTQFNYQINGILWVILPDPMETVIIEYFLESNIEVRILNSIIETVICYEIH